MKVAPAILAAVIAVPALAALANPAPQAPRPDPDFTQAPSNAALLYSRTWMLEVDNSLRKLADVNWADPGFTITPDITAALAANRGIIDGLLRASAVDDCDWGIDYDLGFEAMLPHLSKLRSSARALAVDARVKALQGDSAGAAQRVAAIFDLSRHAGGDQLLIVSLVSQAIANLGADLTDALRPSLTPQGKALVLAAASRLDTDDPFAARAGIRGEGLMIQKWVKARCTGHDAGKKFIQLIVPAVEGADNNNTSHEVQLKLSGADEATLAADLDKATRVANDSLAVWNEPDAAQRLKEISDRIQAGKYGTAALAIAPALTRYYESTQKSLTKLRGVIESLQPGSDMPAKPSSR
jgi:hypothetical protein